METDDFNMPNKLFVIEHDADTGTHIGHAEAGQVMSDTQGHYVGVYELVAVKIMEPKQAAKILETVWVRPKNGKKQ